jgi:hypothetical protein
MALDPAVIRRYLANAKAATTSDASAGAADFSIAPSASVLASFASFVASSLNLTEAPAADISLTRGIRLMIGRRKIRSPVTVTVGHVKA